MTPIDLAGAAQAPPHRTLKLGLTLTYIILGSWGHPV
jgi:hypothetical protein